MYRLILFLCSLHYTDAIGMDSTGATGVVGMDSTGATGGATGVVGMDSTGAASEMVTSLPQPAPRITVAYTCNSNFTTIHIEGTKHISINQNSTIYPTGNFSIPHNCSLQFINRNEAIARVNVLQENIDKKRYVSYSVDFKKYGETVRNTTHTYIRKYITPDFIAKNPNDEFTYTFQKGRVYKYGYSNVNNYIIVN